MLEWYDSSVHSALEISDVQVAEFLSNRLRSRHLDPYLAREASVAVAAAELGISAQSMHYWTRRLLRLGLIERVGTAVDGRHRSSIYRSVADSFTMPLELLPTGDVETLALYFTPIWHSFLTAVAVAGRQHSAGWNIHYSRVADQAAFHIVPSSEPTPDLPFSNSWARLKLNRADALQLKQELDGLLAHYLERPTIEHERSYIAHVALVQVDTP